MVERVERVERVEGGVERCPVVGETPLAEP